MNRLLCRGFSFLRTVASIHAATNPNGSKAAVSDAGPPVGRVFRAMRGPEADYASECIISAPECNACGMPAASSAAHERVAAVLQRRPLCVVLLKTDTPAFAILANVCNATLCPHPGQEGAGGDAREGAPPHSTAHTPSII
jgi:hypothetical protein